MTSKMEVFVMTVNIENLHLKDTHREKTPSNKTLAITKSMNTKIWKITTSSQLFRRSS